MPLPDECGLSFAELLERDYRGSPGVFAGQHGLSRELVQQWATGARMPDDRVLTWLVAISHGRVTPQTAFPGQSRHAERERAPDLIARWYDGLCSPSATFARRLRDRKCPRCLSAEARRAES